jgi:ribosomal protein L37E
LTSPEQVIWSNEVTKGFFKKTVVETQKITNYRVIQNSAYVGLGLLDDIVVMNQHRVSESNYTSVGGMRGSPRIGTGKSKSRTVGDIAFIYQGKPHIIYRQIPDPQGVARLAKAARKTFIENKKTAEKMNKARLQEQQQQQKERISRTTTTTPAISNKGIITCPRCSSTTNAQGSKYCNNCGFRLADATNEGIMTNTSSSPSSVNPSQFSINKTTKQNINQFMTYKMPAYGVKINYPSNWRVGKGRTPSASVIFQSPKENPSDILFESVGISSYNITNETPEQLMQGAINQLGKKHHDFTLIESVPTILAGRQAHRIVYEAGRKRYMGVVTIEKNKAYQVMYVAEPSKYDRYLPIVQKMIGSFEIIRTD